MKILYVVAESDNDAYFYALCAEMMTGFGYELVAIRSRKRSGYSAVEKLVKGNLRKARREANGGADVSFIAGIDNDRTPHPENASMDRQKLNDEERNRGSRLDWLTDVYRKELENDPLARRLQTAIAVPVEMLEAWIVQALRESELQPARYFSKSESQRARAFYHPTEPPPQWKDLAAEEQARVEIANKQSFYLHVVSTMDMDALAKRSLSFRIFKDALALWTGAVPAG